MSNYLISFINSNEIEHIESFHEIENSNDTNVKDLLLKKFIDNKLKQREEVKRIAFEQEVIEEQLCFAQELISEILKICKANSRSPKQIKNKILSIIEESGFEI